MDASDLAEQRQIEQMKRVLLSKILTKEAFERLGRVRIVNPQTAEQVELYLLQIYQAGRLEIPVSDEKLKEMLKALSDGKQFRIQRK